MISFACPTCKTAYEVPAAAAGKKTNCRSCGQRLQVPSPSNKTVLGSLLPEKPPVPPPPPPSPGVVPLKPIPGPRPVIKRRRWRWVLGIGTVAVVALLVPLVMYLGFRSIIRPAGVASSRIPPAGSGRRHSDAVEADDLFRAYVNNPIAAQRDYIGKRKKIAGTIAVIDNIGGVTLAPGIRCEFGWADLDQVAKLRRGQKVVIEAECGPLLPIYGGVVRVGDCRLLD